MNQTSTKWDIIEKHNLNKSLLDSLFKGDIGVIRVPNFLSSDLCQKALQSIKTYGIDYYEGVYPKIGKIGITQFEHRFSPALKDQYFEKAAKANKARISIFKDTGDLVSMVIDFLNKGWDQRVNLAVEEGTNNSYYAGLIRVINQALLHTDWAGGLDGLNPNWTIGKINSQLAWNIYLQSSTRGGSTVVYRRLWRKSDESYYKLKDSYGYDPSMVLNTDFVEFTPKQGELVLFNSQNYHEVEKVEGDTERISISSFIGLTPKNELILWS
jgi:hypothetical protein